MDPAVVSFSGDRVVGEIELSLKYKPEQNTLLVKVGRAKNLHLAGSHGLPDPYVQVELLIKRFGDSVPQCKKTKQKPRTNNPLFQEILVFSLEDQDVAEARLKLSIWDKDKISDDDFLGEVILELCKLDLEGRLASWYKLHPQTDLSVSGSIELSLNHQLPGKLLVTIHQASDLKAAGKISKTSDPYVRCYVTGVPNREETKVISDTLNPNFEETFEFSVHQDEFEQRVLVLNVLSRETLGRDKRLGDVHIPLKNFDPSETWREWFNLADLRNTPHARSKWSEEGISQEFREAMRAHAIYKYPRCIFQGKHLGKKLVSVNSEKARASAKMVVVNGFPIRQ